MGHNRDLRRQRLRDREAPVAAVPDEGHPKPIFAVESRPSTLTGVSFWAVLTYKEHLFQEMLPPDFMGLDETGQALACAEPLERLRAKLAPILQAEDDECTTDSATSAESSGTAPTCASPSG